MKCTESEEEEVTKGKENQLQLSCFINQEVKYLFTGLKLVRMIRVDPHYLWILYLQISYLRMQLLDKNLFVTQHQYFWCFHGHLKMCLVWQKV